MSQVKRKIPVSLDEDLVEALEREGQGRHRLLEELLDQLDAEHGPVDESLVAKYVEILG